MQNRIILLIDMDYFFAQIEERENPRFKGKPVVVGAEPAGGSGRGVVSTANYEARKLGIHSALPISSAYRLCPQAVFLPVNMALYAEVSARIMGIIRSFAQLVEQVSLDEAYVDVSFLKTYEQAKALAEKLKKTILEKEKLTATIGIGPNKTIAKIACSKAKPNGLKMVMPAEAENFLEPLPIEDLPGIGPKTASKLKAFANNPDMIVKDLKKLGEKNLEQLFGAWGKEMYERARGIDHSEISAEEITKSIGKEFTFEKDTRDPEELLLVFENLLKDVWKEASEAHFSFKTITVVSRFTGFETHTKSKTLKTASQDFSAFKKEATKLLLRFIMENPKPFRLIGVRVSNFLID